MCSAPKIPEAKRFQASESPVYRDRSETFNKGRRSTMLTGGSGIQDSAVTTKKTALGQ